MGLSMSKILFITISVLSASFAKANMKDSEIGSESIKTEVPNLEDSAASYLSFGSLAELGEEGAKVAGTAAKTVKSAGTAVLGATKTLFSRALALANAMGGTVKEVALSVGRAAKELGAPIERTITRLEDASTGLKASGYSLVDFFKVGNYYGYSTAFDAIEEAGSTARAIEDTTRVINETAKTAENLEFLAEEAENLVRLKKLAANPTGYRISKFEKLFREMGGRLLSPSQFGVR